MWLLSSRGRPELCQKTLDACAVAKMASPGIVYVDTRVSDYPNLKLPNNWTKVLGNKDLAPSKQEFYEHYKDERFYGFLADDTLPQTEYFDTQIEEAAKDWFFVDCYDGGYANRGDHLSAGLPIPFSGAHGWGGKLVRAVGWWALPGIRQFTTGNAWTYLLHQLEIDSTLSWRKYLADVTVEHNNWRTGNRIKDETDNWEREGKNYRDADFMVYEKYRCSGEFNQIVKRVQNLREGQNKALVLVDIWDESGLSYKKDPTWWAEAVEITQNKIVPILEKARRAGWIIIHCHSGLNTLPEVVPIPGEFEVPYDAPIHLHCPKALLSEISTMYFVGFTLNICLLGNQCGIKQTSAFMPRIELILLQDCTKASAAEGRSEEENLISTLRNLKAFCKISTSDNILGS